MNPISEWQDAFEKQVSVTTNEADLAGHHPFSSERFRVFRNGTRQFVQYDSVPEYQKLVGAHEIAPQTAGDVVTFETAERYRYVVQYVIEWSAALMTNQPLQSGEGVTFALGDADLVNSTDGTPGPNADGWMWYWTGDHDGTDVTVAEYRAGEERSAETVSLEKPLETWSRLAAETNWYNVGNTKFVETFTDNGSQHNPIVGWTSVDDGKGPETANKPIQVSVKAEGGAGSLTAQVGSTGARTLGDVDAVTREKTDEFTATIGTTGTWVPIYATRVRPGYETVNVQLKATDILGYSVDADIRVMPVAVAPEKLRDGGGAQLTDADYSVPVVQSAQNTAIETTTAVAEIPDSTGTVGPSAANPGGHQLGFASSHTSGTGSKSATKSGGTTRKRQISPRDVCVFLAFADSAGDIDVEYITAQEW